MVGQCEYGTLVLGPPNYIIKTSLLCAVHTFRRSAVQPFHRSSNTLKMYCDTQNRCRRKSKHSPLFLTHTLSVRTTTRLKLIEVNWSVFGNFNSIFTLNLSSSIGSVIQFNTLQTVQVNHRATAFDENGLYLNRES